MQETTNYKLKKPEYNEYADIMDINHNMDILDEEVNKKLDKTKKAADSEKLDGLDSLMFARSYSLHANDSIPKDVLNNPAYPQSYMGSINYGTEIGFTQGYIKIIYIPHASDGYGTQIAIPYDGGITYGMYYRNAVGNTWGEWIEQLDTRKRYPSDPTTIAVDNDANKCLATGKAYYCKHNATQNLPFGTVDDGILIPYIHFNNPIYGFQIFMTWNHQSIWWRRAINNNWDRWHCIGGGSWNQEIQKDSEQVMKYMRWGSYGQSHVIFDASKSIRPDGQSCDRTNSNQPWTAANCPTLMGFNGGATWGVRVDNARTSDQVQGFQFRNNNGILEVLINGVWMAVGGQVYNNLKQFNFSTYTTTTNNGTTYYNPTVREGEVKTLVDIQRPCKLVAMNSTSSLVYTAGNHIGTACRGIRELRIYIDDILKFTALVVQFNGSGSAQGEYVINGDNYVGANTGSTYYAGSYLKNLEARKRFKIDALIGTGINRDGSTYNNGRTPTISTFFAQFLVND
nr:MAG TPA: tail fiber protein [Caudoviricetes sp.]